MAILESRFFDIRYKFWVHIFELLLVVAAMGLSVPRLFAKNQPRTRANTIALGMVRELLVFIFQRYAKQQQGAKSIIFILYQLLTEHVARFYRWQSSKANTILNSLEIVFWGAVVFLLIQANISICMGYTCVLSWIVAGIAISLRYEVRANG